MSPQPRAAGALGRGARWVGTCWSCGKTSYTSRHRARTAARKVHPSEKMHAYLCRGSGYYHYGHDELWRERASDDLLWMPLPDLARVQINRMGTDVRKARTVA